MPDWKLDCTRTIEPLHLRSTSPQYLISASHYGLVKKYKTKGLRAMCDWGWTRVTRNYSLCPAHWVCWTHGHSLPGCVAVPVLLVDRGYFGLNIVKLANATPGSVKSGSKRILQRSTSPYYVAADFVSHIVLLYGICVGYNSHFNNNYSNK
ncbi:hypothetical protein JYU34_009361, partial [Plutella xylostella]